jgi:predicted secreted protein|tara:strand:+ start:2187 stop:2429 length:243 start_codon:yes stop_codon:yes gene_type:complete
MDFVSGLVVFLLLWWWVFLMSLPFGVRTVDTPETGHASSAPARPMLWRKVLVTTIIAGALTVLVNWIIAAQIISFGMLAG